jgi:SprT protein
MRSVAGCAYTGKFKRIELSEQLFLENIESFFENTIPHEVAHILTEILYPNAKQDHGPEWKSVMRELGIEPVRCHNYDTSSCYNDTRIRYNCVCSTHHLLSKIRHNKAKLGTEYSCGTCKTRLIEHITTDIY